MTSTTYRPDIDGLRAIAVLAIVLFHLDIEPFSGGYVGVDIFFVISGFLITSIIAREIDAGEFSLRRFYERRVRRIAPALFVTLLATLAVGALLLPTEQRVDLGQSAAATTGFVSNFYFFANAGYFDGPSEHKPLLHTWSLAVEEQFYILFPLLLMLLARLRQHRAACLLALALVSLGACIAITPIYPDAAFYLIPFRAWELLIGSLLALGLLAPPTTRAVREALAVAGLALMLGSILLFTPATHFPGAAALVPTLGAALLIHAGLGGQTLVGRMLSLRPMVLIGLLSYSLYLWHWPIVVYGKQFLINPPTDEEIGVMLLLMFAAAFLSWRFVEQPFRNRKGYWTQPRIFALGGTAALSVLVASVAIGLLKGDSSQALPVDLRELVEADPGLSHWRACEKAGEQALDALDFCSLGDPDAREDFLFWGDSHAMALATAVNISAAELGQAGHLAISGGCQPLLGVVRSGRQNCDEFNQKVLRWLEARPEIHTVLLAGRWALLTEGVRYKGEEGDGVRLRAVSRSSDGDPESLVANNRRLFEVGLRRSIEAIQALGREVVLVNQVPEIGYNVVTATRMAQLTGRDVEQAIAPSRDEYQARLRAATSIISKLGGEYAVEIVDPGLLLCPDARCAILYAGTPLYRDDNHLSTLGSVLVAGAFTPLLIAD